MSAVAAIDTLWAESIKDLRQSQIDLTDAPLFLVLGRNAGGEHTLFQAAQVPLVVQSAPQHASVPYRFFASAEGIYLNCLETSLLSRQAELLSAQPGAEEPQSEEDFFQTLRPKPHQKKIQAVLARAQKEGRPLDDTEREELRRLQSGGQVSVLRDLDEIAALEGQLRRLCELIAETRRPYCPLNGILVIIPYAALARDDLALQFAELLYKDLSIIQATLRVHCPVLMLIANMESTPGFREFIERFPPEQRQRRLGLRLPHAPDLAAEEWPAMLEGAAYWICESLMPSWIYRLLRLDPSAASPDKKTLGNAGLANLLAEMHQRGPHLAQILAGIPVDPKAPPLFGGCYLAGTGADVESEQAFAPGVFRRLLEDQNFVSWTRAALAEEAGYQRWANLGYAAIGLTASILAGLGVFALTR